MNECDENTACEIRETRAEEAPVGLNMVEGPVPVEMADSAGVTQPPVAEKRRGSGRKKSMTTADDTGGSGQKRRAKATRPGQQAMGDLLVPLPDPASPTGDSAAGAANGSVKGLASLRLSQDFALTAGVKKVLLTVPVRKPGPQEWLTVHPDPEMHFAAGLIVLKEEGEMYVVDGALRDELVGEWVPMMLYPAINRQGVTFLWPGRDGRSHPGVPRRLHSLGLRGVYTGPDALPMREAVGLIPPLGTPGAGLKLLRTGEAK